MSAARELLTAGMDRNYTCCTTHDDLAHEDERKHVAEAILEANPDLIVTTVPQLAAAMHKADVGCGDDGRNLHYQDGEASPIALHMDDAAAIAAALKEADHD